MWSYNKTDTGYQIKKESDTTSLSFNISRRQEIDNTVIFWNDKQIQSLIDGLNDGSIPFHISTDYKKKLQSDDNVSFEFSFNIPQTKININKTLKHNNIKLL